VIDWATFFHGVTVGIVIAQMTTILVQAAMEMSRTRRERIAGRKNT
jgi:hypothetical protein